MSSNYSALDKLQEYCIGRAESETIYLPDVFVPPDVYRDILLAPPSSPYFLVGRKGTGKSALLHFVRMKAMESKLKVIYLKPDDIPLLEGISHVSETSTIKRKAYEALVTVVAVEVGKDLRGLLGRKEKKLFDKAVNAQEREPDFIQLAANYLSRIGSAVTDIDFSKLLDPLSDPNAAALKDALQTNFSRAPKAIYLLLDDVDQVASMVNREQVNRIWGFILAAQRLSEEFPNIRVVISLRTEVWGLMNRDSSGQYDQVDHIRNVVRKLDPSETQIRQIIEQRLRAVCASIPEIDCSEPVECFFEQSKVMLPTSVKEERLWLDFLAKNARGRPRDALQFVWCLAKFAKQKRKSKISQSIVDMAEREYSDQRMEDLVKEYALDCGVLREICDSFSRLDFAFSSETMKDHLRTIPSRFGVEIRGHQLRPDSDDDIYLLWRLVYETGFCNPRVTNLSRERDFEHISYDSDPDFVSRANWNQMQTAEWEVHPAYRSYLLQKKERESARTSRLSSLFRKK